MLDTDATPPGGSGPADAEDGGGEGWPEPSPEPSWWQRQDPWSLSALALAVIGLVPLTWEVPLISLLAVAFALIGLRDESAPNRWMAVVALVVGLMTLAVVVVATSLGEVAFLPFWTQP